MARYPIENLRMEAAAVEENRERWSSTSIVRVCLSREYLHFINIDRLEVNIIKRTKNELIIKLIV